MYIKNHLGLSLFCNLYFFVTISRILSPIETETISIYVSDENLEPELQERVKPIFM